MNSSQGESDPPEISCTWQSITFFYLLSVFFPLSPLKRVYWVWLIKQSELLDFLDLIQNKYYQLSCEWTRGSLCSWSCRIFHCASLAFPLWRGILQKQSIITRSLKKNPLQERRAEWFLLCLCVWRKIFPVAENRVELNHVIYRHQCKC